MNLILEEESPIQPEPTEEGAFAPNIEYSAFNKDKVYDLVPSNDTDLFRPPTLPNSGTCYRLLRTDCMVVLTNP